MDAETWSPDIRPEHKWGECGCQGHYTPVCQDRPVHTWCPPCEGPPWDISHIITLVYLCCEFLTDDLCILETSFLEVLPLVSGRNVVCSGGRWDSRSSGWAGLLQHSSGLASWVGSGNPPLKQSQANEWIQLFLSSCKPKMFTILRTLEGFCDD